MENKLDKKRTHKNVARLDEMEKKPDAMIRPRKESVLAKRIILLNDIAAGKSLNEIYESHLDWGETRHGIYLQILEASKEYFNQDYIDGIKARNAARLEKLYEDAISTGDIKTAVKVLEAENKILDSWSNRNIKLDSGDGNITVSFNF